MGQGGADGRMGVLSVMMNEANSHLLRWSFSSQAVYDPSLDACRVMGLIVDACIGVP